MSRSSITLKTVWPSRDELHGMLVMVAKLPRVWDVWVHSHDAVMLVAGAEPPSLRGDKEWKRVAAHVRLDTPLDALADRLWELTLMVTRGPGTRD